MGLFGPSEPDIERALSEAVPTLRWAVTAQRMHVKVFVASTLSGPLLGSSPDPLEAQRHARAAWDAAASRFGMARLSKNSQRVLVVNVQASDGHYYGIDHAGVPFGPQRGLCAF